MLIFTYKEQPIITHTGMHVVNKRAQEWMRKRTAWSPIPSQNRHTGRTKPGKSCFGRNGVMDERDTCGRRGRISASLRFFKRNLLNRRPSLRERSNQDLRTQGRMSYKRQLAKLKTSHRGGKEREKNHIHYPKSQCVPAGGPHRGGKKQAREEGE